MSEQEIMQTKFHAIVEGITQIMNATCTDANVLKIWEEEAVNWFAEMDRTAHIKYWNLAPEVIVDMKWTKLWNVLNASLSIQTPLHEWEKQISDFILNFEWISNDEEKDTNKQIHNTPEEPGEQDEYDQNAYDQNAYDQNAYDDEYYEDEEEREEERRLGRMERAASRNDERRGRY